MKRTRILRWSVLAGVLSWATHAYSQDLDGTIKHTAQTITIDGKDDEAVWGEANLYGNDGFFTAANEPPDNEEDLACQWRALWDDENLYFFIEVTDDSNVVGDNNDWQDDSIELYLDADGLGKDEGPTVQDYNTVRDFPVFQLTILSGEIELHNGINHENWIVANDDVADMNAVAVTDDLPNYSFEMAIPWATLGDSTPEDIIERGFFGLGLAVNDDDDEEGRDSQIMWATESGELWHDATVFPDVGLEFPDVPGPEISVKSHVDQGQLDSANPTHDFVLPVRNWGQENALTISSTTVTGPDKDLVTLGELTTVPANSVGELPYTLNTGGRTGAFDFNIVIESDATQPENQTKTVRVTASVINFSGPAIHYAMDDGVDATELRDITGYNRHGTLDGATIVEGGLATGGALSVGGGSQGVIPGGHLGALEAFSLAMWIEPSELGDAQTVISQGVGSPTFAILIQQGDINWFAGGAPEFGATGAIAAGTKYHVVVTYSAEQAAIYLDGVEAATQDSPVDVSLIPEDNYFIGAFDSTLPFSGLIDDVQIYDRVIDGEEAAFLFANPGQPIQPDGGNVPTPDADAVVLGTDQAAGYVDAGAAVGDAGLRGSYWLLEPKATPTDELPMHRAGADGANAGWVDDNVYNTESTGTFTATTFDYGGNDLTPVKEWLGGDADSFAGTEGNLDDGVFRFEGYLWAAAAGNQEITFTSDDGSVLYVGNQLVINNDNSHGNQDVTGKVYFPQPGLYPVDIRYFNGDWTNEAGDHGGANFIVQGMDNVVQWAGSPPLPPIEGTVVYENDFTYDDGTTDLGDGSIIASNDGVNSIQGGALRMTKAGTNSSAASFVFHPGDLSGGWTATFDFAVEHTGGNTPADGFSVNYGLIPEGDNFGDPAEEGYGAATPHVSYQVDTWLWNDAAGQDAGVGIELTGDELALTKAADDDANFKPNERVEASAVISWDPVNGASFSTTGLRTNADFVNLATDGFAPDGTYGFSILARTGGHNETVEIDNLVVYSHADSGGGGGADRAALGAVAVSSGAQTEPGLVDFGDLTGDATYEFSFNAVKGGASTAITGNDAWGLKLDQWNEQGIIGTTQFGVADNLFTALDGQSVASVFDQDVHMVFVNDTTGGETRLYIDGVQVGVWAGNIELAGMVQLMGARIENPVDFMGDGSVMHGWATYNTVLEDGDIEALSTTPFPEGLAPGDSFVLENVGISDSGAFTMTIPDGVTADVEYSTDLINWEVIATGVTGTLEETDAGRLAAPAGFYRAK